MQFGIFSNNFYAGCRELVSSRIIIRNYGGEIYIYIIKERGGEGRPPPGNALLYIYQRMSPGGGKRLDASKERRCAPSSSIS